jgi:NADH:ubiquinone oxidoreductase subunit C
MATATTTLRAGQIGEYLTGALESDVLEAADVFGTPRVTLEPQALPRAARLCKSDPRLAFDYFDWLSAVDLGTQGFAVVVALYSVRHRHRVLLRVIAPGGRDDPRVPTITGIYRGANWHERETYDMFGVTFDGHPGLLPRILTVENFEGWPLRKEFLLSSREAKPWPGAKEPEERKEEPGHGQSVATVGNAQPLSAEQKDAAAEQLAATAEPAAREEVDYDQSVYEALLAEGKSERVARARAKAAAMRAQRSGPAPTAPAPEDAARAPRAPLAAPVTGEPAVDERAVRAQAAADADGSHPTTAPTAGDTDAAATAQAQAAAGDPAPSSPEGAAEVAVEDMADPSIAMDAAAGAVGGDVAAGAPGDQPASDTPVSDMAQEVRTGMGAPPVAGGSPGPEAEGRHGGAVEQSGQRPAADTPGMTAAPTAPPERGQGGDVANETPAPGPRAGAREESHDAVDASGAESDVPTAGGGAPGTAHRDDVPVRPAPGAEAAPMPEDDLGLEPGSDQPGVDETPLFHEGAVEPAPAPGTDADDRAGRRYGAGGSVNEADGESDDERGAS